MMTGTLLRRRPRVSPGGGSLDFPNRPSDFTVITDFPCSAYPAAVGGSPPNGAMWDYEDVNPVAAIITDATAPMPAGFSDNKYYKIEFSSSTMSIPGNSPVSLRYVFNSSDTWQQIYCAFWLRHDTGWENNPDHGGTNSGRKSGVKLLWYDVNAADGDGQCYTGHDNGDALGDPAQNQMNFQFSQQTGGSPTGVNRDSRGNMPSASTNGNVFSKIGQWVLYETLAKLNTAQGAANGEFHSWIDGVKVHQLTNVVFNAVNARKFYAIRPNESTFGGGGTLPASPQYQSLSHIHIAGKATL